MLKADHNCRLCKIGKTVEKACLLGRGNTRKADIMIVGEAPSSKDFKRWEVFSGSTGNLLVSMLEELEIDLDRVYFTNAVHCCPPEFRQPTKAEVKSCSKWLWDEIAEVDPDYVLLMGNGPLLSVLGKTGIKKARGRPVEVNGVIYLPVNNPAAAAHDPRALGLFQHDLRTFRNIIEFGGIPEERELDYKVVEDEETFQAMIDDLWGPVSSDLETSGLYPWTDEAQVVSIGFGTRRHQWVIPTQQGKRFRGWVDEITEKLEDCYLIGHNWKFDALWMKVHYGVDWVCDFDTMMAHYILDENDQHGLKYLAQKFLGAPDWDVSKDVKTSWSPAMAKYHAHDLFYTLRLKDYLAKWLDKDWQLKRVYRKIIVPCIRLFTEIEYHGVYINVDQMDEAEAYLREELRKAEEELNKWGPDINWRSPKQVADLLFNRLEIEVIELTKSGAQSVSESVIKRIDHPVSAAMLQYRAADKQLSSFIEGWRPFLAQDRSSNRKSRLHPSFKLHGTVTGRLSCEHPNLQQVPRDERIRSLITAPPGWTMLECDLSQIELRIAAELAQEKNMLYAFTHGIDVHWLTAIREISRGGGLKAEVLLTARKYLESGVHSKYAVKHKLTPKNLTYGDAIQLLLEMGPDVAKDNYKGWGELRKKAKAVNFGYLYGMWWKKFKLYARDNYGVTVTDEQAQDSRKAFFENYPDLPAWHERQRKMVRAEGYIRTLSGRCRRLPKAMSRDNTPERQEAERQAINTPVQSFANELNLMAALQLREEYTPKVLRIVGTVHDAILMEVRDDMVEEITLRTLEIMRGPKLLREFEIELSVPIEAEAKIGPWGLGKGIEKWKASK